MSIKVNTFTAFGLMTELAIQPDLMQWLNSSGYHAKLVAGKIQFTNPEDMHPQPILAHVPVTLAEIKALKAGTLPENDLVDLRLSLEEAIEALQALPNGPKPQAQGQSALAKLPKSVAKAPTPLKAPPEPWPMFDISKLHTAPTKSLTSATHMYQPVTGTSANSRYYLVAANKELQVAARWRPGDVALSVRVEGLGFLKHQDAIQKAGLDNKGTYASVHVGCADPVLARKTLGSILFGIGEPMETPMPDLNIIAEPKA